LIAVSYFLCSHFVVLIGTGVICGVLLRLALRTSAGELVLDWARLRLPLLGNLGLKSALGRFTRTLGTLLGAGVPILQALTIARETSGNVHVARAIAAVHQQVKVGGAIAASLAAQPLFPPMLVGMVEVGEETGALAKMLNRVADTYDDDVENAVAALATIIEPVMIVLMALIVGTIVIALFLPLVGIIQQM
jgi:type IV pilus assembly protein PilC